MIEGIEGDAVLPEVLRYTEEHARLAFADGLATYMRNWSYAAELLREPALSDSWDDPLVTGPLAVWPELERSIEQARPRPVTPAYPLVSQAIHRNVHAALTGRLPPTRPPVVAKSPTHPVWRVGGALWSAWLHCPVGWRRVVCVRCTGAG
jgi:hypothetical protein